MTSPAEYAFAAMFVAGVAGIIGWGSWAFWVQRKERQMLSEVLAMMRRDGEGASTAAQEPRQDG